MKKSEVLKSLSGHLSVDKLLSEYPALGREGLSRLLAEAAGALGPARIEAAAGPKKAGRKAGAGRLRMFTDGASRGNPGEAGLGVLIEDEDGQIVRKLARYLGRTTNNQAEYAALIAGLEAAAELGAGELSVFADSELIVKQMNGEYRVKDPGLQERHAEARSLLENFHRVVIKYIPREKNREADSLANEAIDKRSR